MSYSKIKNKHIAALTAIIIAFAAFWAAHDNNGNDGSEKIIVRTQAVEKTDLEIYDIYQGRLISRQSVNLKSRITGQITDIKVKAGDKVRKGDILINIDSRKQESLLVSYKSKQPFLETNLQTAKAQYERYKELHEKNTISRQDYENALNAYKRAEADLKENTQFINNESVELGYYSIKAPFSGTVGNIPVKTGQMISPEEELLSITQNDFLELNIGVPENRSFDLKKGLKIQVLDKDNKIVCSSVLSFISPVVDINTQTILTKSLFDNKNGILRAYQSVKAKIIYDNAAGIAIPFTAVTKIAGQDFVYKAEESSEDLIAKQTQISVGELQNGKYIVKDGLKEGDRIVIHGTQKLYDGAVIAEDAEKL